MLDVLFPPSCVVCGASGGGLCLRCAETLEAPRCSTTPPGLDHLVALCAYRCTGRDLVLALKRGNRRAALPLLGRSLAEAVVQHVGSRGSAALRTTWAPTTRARARTRGFDQAQLLAQAVATAMGGRCEAALRRSGTALMGRSAAQRQQTGGFEVLSRRPGCEGTWLVVDDVVTTGATMGAAAETLRAAGAAAVIGAVVAVTEP